MKVLLTGATGFIGSRVARTLLEAGDEVHALLRPSSNRERIEEIRDSLREVPGDLLDPAFTLPPGSWDVCIHLAWYVEPGKYLESPQNPAYEAASLALARQLLQAKCPRLVGAGTCFEYDTDLGTLRESSATRPRTGYARSKLALFQALEKLDLDVAWTRFFYQYGPFEDPRRLMPVVIRSLLRGQTVRLTPGNQVRDFLHVDDVAGAVAAVARAPVTGAVNIGSGQPVTVREIAEKIGGLIGKPELIALGAQPYAPGDPMRVVADNARLRGCTDWRQRISLDEGLQTTIEWWKSRGDS